MSWELDVETRDMSGHSIPCTEGRDFSPGQSPPPRIIACRNNRRDIAQE